MKLREALDELREDLDACQGAADFEDGPSLGESAYRALVGHAERLEQIASPGCRMRVSTEAGSNDCRGRGLPDHVSCSACVAGRLLDGEGA